MSRFFKYEALGNDYIVLDPREFTADLSPERVRRVCDRHFGLGSDGILYGPEFGPGGLPRVTIFNPDGSRAEKSGNGIRIFAKHLFEQGYVKSPEFELETPGGRVEVRINDPGATDITVRMGKLIFGGKRQLALGGRSYNLEIASIGNPHCVVVLDRVSAEMARELGPRIERHELFPQGTNVQLVEVLDPENIKLEIWERGVGYTLASGTSSAAAAGVCRRLGLCGDRVKVRMPGGELAIRIADDYEIFLRGRVSSVAAGNFTSEFLARLQVLV